MTPAALLRVSWRFNLKCAWWGGDVRSLVGLLGCGEELDLDTVDTVDAVDEENENEDETDLHPVLYLGDYRVLGDEAIVVS